MRTARLVPEAEAELRAAASWYKERAPEVARRFLGEARALFPGFPYAMIFLVADDVIHMLAVAHQHRAPGYWLYRIIQS